MPSPVFGKVSGKEGGDEGAIADVTMLVLQAIAYDVRDQVVQRLESEPERPASEKKTRDRTLGNKPAAPPLALGLPHSRFNTGGKELLGLLNAGLELVGHFKLILEKVFQPLMDLAQFLRRELLHRGLDFLNLSHRSKITFHLAANKLD